MLPTSLIARALTRLLSHDDAARKLLAAHAGESLQLRMPPLSTTLTITADGSFAPGAASLTEKELAVKNHHRLRTRFNLRIQILCH